jgi:hypothetical protein
VDPGCASRGAALDIFVLSLIEHEKKKPLRVNAVQLKTPTHAGWRFRFPDKTQA